MTDSRVTREAVEGRKECFGCVNNWPLGRYGCHFEPIPDELLDEDGFAPRRKMDCQNWAERRKEFYA